MTDIPAARPSATVVVVRDGPTAPEILMVQRHAKASFGHAFAFPGGVLEPVDAHAKVHEACLGVSASQANALLQTDNGLDYYSAAIRELFEETGVLLAEADGPLDGLEVARQRLNEGRLDWQEFVTSNSLRLRCGELRYFSYWITPDTLQKRYSTRFFMARLPAGQEARHCDIELVDSTWMSARDVLLASRADRMSLHFPTLNTIKNLSQHETLDAIVEWCALREQAGVPCNYPQMVDGRPVLR